LSASQCCIPGRMATFQVTGVVLFSARPPTP
jgi:hypothetical protein